MKPDYRAVNAVTQCPVCRAIHQPGAKRWVVYRHNGFEPVWEYYCRKCLPKDKGAKHG